MKMVARWWMGNSFTQFSSFIFVFIVFCLSSTHSTNPLYNEHDDVISLQNDSYDGTVLNTGNGWLVEFYNSWCGHCVRYAPIYKQLATDIKAWKAFVKVAAVDCAQDYNTMLCQSFVIKMYPTLKFFPALASKRVNGSDFPGLNSVDLLREKVVDFISNTSLSNIRSRRLRFLEPLRNVADVWLSSALGTQRAVLIFESQNSYLGRQVILDMYPHKRLVVKRMLADDVAKYGVTEVPSVFLVDKSDGSFTQLAVGNNHTEYVRVLTNMIGISIPSEIVTPTPSGDAIRKFRPILDQQMTKVKMNEMQDSRTKAANENDALQRRDFNSLADNYMNVHEQDLESSLHYSLRHEVALVSTISDESLVALKQYIGILAKYLPVQRPISLLLHKINDWLQNWHGPLKGSGWLEAINQLQSPGEILPESTTWTGCRGSDPKYRGYPCSLWTTFHTLSVAAYEKAMERQDDDDAEDLILKEVLLAIRGYVKFFFGCRECSENFMKGAVHIEEKVKDAKSGVLFLWRSHNRANNFLSGDLTEDPFHPKLQFPTIQQCPFCHASNKEDGSSSNFNENEVLVFLLNMYTKKKKVPTATLR